MFSIRLLCITLFSLFCYSVSAQTGLVRGPYLQAATDTSVHIRWRTTSAENSQVQWGTSAGNLSSSKQIATPVTEHEVVLTGLQPSTRYWYSIGSTTNVLQGNADNYFQTLPSRGAKERVRIGVIGDCGNNSANQLNIRNQVLSYLGPAYMNAWVLLGDNAYSYGLDAEYQTSFFDVYKDRFLKQSPLFPSPGNHDYSDDANFQNNHNIPYYSNFTMPIAGEAGGVPSGNQAFYSFDVGNIHFLSLDAFGKEDNSTRIYDTTGRQVQWVKQDLAANQNKDWIVAYWHHPPYTKGSHNSDTEAELIAIRNNFIRILERYGVDLILCGHSHVYERSRLQAGHFGTEDSFDPALHNLSSSSGLYDGSSNACPYVKGTANTGTVYAVAGSAGQLGGTSPGFPHNAMVYSNTTEGGAMLLEVEDNRLDAKWICADGVIRDRFTLMKRVNTKQTVAINAGDSVVLKASFLDDYVWQPNGAITRTIKVSPPATTTYYVADAYGCLRDTFTVSINNVPLPLVWGSLKGRFSKADQSVVLNWRVWQEKDVQQYIIERSVNGLAFEKLGSVTASNLSTDYEWKDAAVERARTAYRYRIRQQGRDGSQSLSEIITVRLVNEEKANVLIAPNPARQADFRIRLLNSSGAIQATVMVTDAAGKRLAEKQLMIGSQPQSFLPPVSAGVYFVTVRTDGFIEVQKIVVE